MMINNNRKTLPKKDTKERNISTKPESNQPGIKSVFNTVQKRKSSISAKSGPLKPGHKQTPSEPTALKPADKKKRSPSSPPDQIAPHKKLNMEPPTQSSNDQERDKKRLSEELTPELAALRELLNIDLDAKIQPLRTEIASLVKSQQVLQEKSELIDNIKQENKQLKIEYNQMKRENENLKYRIEAIENRLLENNVIIRGVEDQAWELNEVTREKTLAIISHIANGKTSKDKMDIVRRIPIRNISRLGNYSTYRHRPIRIEFVNKPSADFLINHRKNLPNGIFVDREYNSDVENDRLLLRPILRRAKELDEYKWKCKMEGGNLVIKGKTYTTKSLHLLPVELNGYNVSSKTTDTSVGFFGELSPFSNFHKSRFEVDGMEYQSAEQYLQSQKALLFQDKEMADQILLCNSSLRCKQLSKEISGYTNDTWAASAESITYKGLKAKFTQNPTLLKLLTETNNKKLVECSYDRVWGCGIPLHNENCLDETLWRGDNLLGTILMRIRSEAINIIGNNEGENMDT